MKKIVTIVLTVLLVFSLAACGSTGNESGQGGSGSEGTSQSSEGKDNKDKKANNDGGNWMADYNMRDLAVPEGATVSEPIAYSNTNRNIKRDIAFTEAEVATFAQSVLESCNRPYTSKYDAEKDEYVRIELTNAEDAKKLDEYGWKYEENENTYSIRIYFGIETTIGFEKY